MKITIEGTRGEDFPNSLCDDPVFIIKMKQSVRKRMELRPSDEVVIIFTDRKEGV